jgi:hypothetical protein
MSQIKDSIPGAQGFAGIQGPPTVPPAYDGRDGEDSFIPGPSAPSGAGLNWIDVPFNAGDFTEGTGLGHWIVALGDVLNFSYMLSGDLMIINFNSSGSDGVGSLRLKIPAGKKCLQSIHTISGYAQDTGVYYVAELRGWNNVTYINIEKSVIGTFINDSLFDNVGGGGIELGFQIALKVG